MLNSTTPTSSVQRVSKHAMAILCVALAVGLIGTAAVQGHNTPKDEIKVRFVSPVRTVQDPTLFESSHRHESHTDHTDEFLMAMSAAPLVGPEKKTLIATPRTMLMEVTAYCSCTKCCGKNAKGITASGKKVSYNNSKFVAADTSVLPFGSKLVIPGYASGKAVEVIDRGGAIKGNKLDVYFSSHKEALKWGRQKLTVMVLPK